MNWKELPDGLYFIDPDGDLAPETKSTSYDITSHGSIKQSEIANYTTNKVYYVPNAACGSDYSGNLLEVSNYNVLRDDYGTIDGVIMLHDNYGTFAIAFRLDVIEKNEELQDILKGIRHYPLISSDELEHLEQEEQERAWTDWAKDDYTTAIRNKIDPDDKHKTEKVGLINNLSENDLATMFYKAQEASNEYWVNEEGSSMWIDVEKLAEHTDLTELFMVFDNPALYELHKAEVIGQRRLIEE